MTTPPSFWSVAKTGPAPALNGQPISTRAKTAAGRQRCSPPPFFFFVQTHQIPIDHLTGNVLHVWASEARTVGCLRTMCGRQSPDRKRKNAALFCKPVTVGFPPSAALSLLPAFVPAVCVATLCLSVSMSCCCAVLLLCECGYHFVIRSEIQHREVFLYHLCLSLTVISSLMHPLSLSLSSNSLSSLGIRSFFLLFFLLYIFFHIWIQPYVCLLTWS